MKAATIIRAIKLRRVKISIHAAREGGDHPKPYDDYHQQISIHAAREGGDFTHYKSSVIVRISIHAAREGGDGAGLRQT